MKPKTTDELWKVLTSVHSRQALKGFTDSLSSKKAALSFPEYMKQKMLEKGIAKASLIQKAQLPRTYGYQILDGTRKPGRNKILALCIALELSLQDTQRALTLGNASQLYPKKKRDSILIFALQKHLTMFEANELLYELEEETLSSSD